MDADEEIWLPPKSITRAGWSDGLVTVYRPDAERHPGLRLTRSPGRPGRKHNPERRAHAPTHQAGTASKRDRQRDRRTGLLQCTESIQEHIPVPTPDSRRLRAGAHVLGDRHHEHAVLLGNA
jgi:hypothetical protein